jgi:hypothetical protein
MRVKLSLGLLALILAGCGSVATVQPSATPNPAALHCRLPVGASADNGKVQPAFIQFPQAQLVPVGPTFGGNQLENQLRAYGGPAYDQPFSTWLPVPPAHVSPDGARYAYADADWSRGVPPTITQVHVVDVRTSRDRVVLDKGAYDVAAFTADGVFLVHHLPQTDASDGLWLLDPDTGHMRNLTTAGTEWFTIGSDAAWSGDLAPGDSAPGKIPADRLLRLDLRTGAVTPWFYRQGQQVAVLGLDWQGHPLVQIVSETKSELWLVTAANTGTLINLSSGGSSADAWTLYWPVVADSHGVWINTNHGVRLYRPGANHLELVYPSQPVTTGFTSISGACQ